jgi:hypothetical protein
MAEAKKQAEKKVYSKNYYIKNIGSIGGLPVDASIDKALDSALSNVKAKATDFHVSEKEYELLVKNSKLQIGITQKAK